MNHYLAKQENFTHDSFVPSGGAKVKEEALTPNASGNLDSYRSPIERYKSHKLAAQEGSQEDSRVYQRDIQGWMERVFGANPNPNSFSPEQKALFSTIKEILSQSSSECSLQQKHSDIAQIFYYWLTQTHHNSNGRGELGERESHLLEMYQEITTTQGQEPKNWQDFLQKVEVLSQQKNATQEQQFYKNMRGVTPERFLTPYGQLGKSLREKEKVHNRIASSSVSAQKKDPSVTATFRPKRAPQTGDPYSQISDLLRGFESTQNQII